MQYQCLTWFMTSEAHPVHETVQYYDCNTYIVLLLFIYFKYLCGIYMYD